MNHRRPSGYLVTGDNELTLHFDDDEENGDDEKLNEDVLFSANHSFNLNDSNNNLCDLNKLQIPTSSMDTLTQSHSNVSLNVPSVSPNSQNLASSPSSPQQHPSILLRTPELNVVQEGEVMQFLPPNHPANYTITSQTNLPPNFRLSSIANNPPASTVHHRTSRCKMALINNQADYCNCKNYRHSMFVGNGHLDYSNNSKQFAPNHLHPDELYAEDYSMANTHTVDAGLNLASSTSMDAVNNQWLVSGKQHICPSCNCNHTNYKKSCVSLSEKHHYHLHQPSCHNLNQLSSYNSQENYLHQSNLKNKEFYLDGASNPKLSGEQPRERLTQILGEMIIPFIFAGLGNVATGYMLSNVQTWAVFKNVPQLIILIPALLGLKGNVEMTLGTCVL